MTRLSFGPLWPSTVGFERMFREIDDLMNTSNSGSTTNFPPHNIIKLDDYRYTVELAIAGFNEDEINITLKDGILEIKGEKKPEDSEIQYLHKGIGTRAFIKSIRLADTVEVRGATFKNGILTVGLENVVPESKKPRKIEIGTELPFVKTEEPKLLVEEEQEAA
jgi:molecular chaperone IbpA